jgi:hypothetical protein
VKKIYTYYDAILGADSMVALELDRKITNIRPVRVIQKGEKDLWSTGKQLMAVGWGGTSKAGDALKSATLRVVDTAVSTGLYRGMMKVNSVKGRVVNGDSGGPLLAGDAQSGFTQVGVFSSSYGGSWGIPWRGYYERLGTDGAIAWLHRLNA